MIIKSKCKQCGEYFEHDTENYGCDECLCSECIRINEIIDDYGEEFHRCEDYKS